MAREQRKLAAIIAADVVGYSRLMGRDESGTLARLRKTRSEHFDPVLTKYGGRLVKLTGDGALVEFASAVDALSAAIEFQQAIAEANSDQPADTALVFRMGLHLGDLIVDGDDLYGDGVNVAARLEGEAPAGGIVISRTVHEAVSGRLKATFDDLGSPALKNIERPIQAFGVKWEPSDWHQAVAAEVTEAPATAPQAALPLPDKPSIAVLPFQNMSGDVEQEYFVDGLVEDIITALSRFKSLFVVARNSSFTYKGKAVDIKQVGRELGVRYVLEGSVRKASNRLRISGQLIDASTGGHLWADHFDGVIEDVFDLQDRLTLGVVGSIAPSVEQAEIERARRKPVLTAYDAYLGGMASIYRRDTWKDTLKLFYEAIELDPDYPVPYAMAARSLAAIRQHWDSDGQRDEAEARRLAFEAAKLAGDDALTLCWAGFVLCYMCHDFDAGVNMIDRALAHNENLAVAWQLRATASVWMGQHRKAIDQVGRAMRLNPKDPDIFRSEHTMATALLLEGMKDEAIPWAKRMLANYPNWPPGLWMAACVFAHAGYIDDARKVAKHLCTRVPDMTISRFKSTTVFRRPSDVKLIVEGLRLSGLPE